MGSLTLTTPIVTSTIPETNLLDSNSKSSENGLTSPNDISSTILRRLLTTPESEAAKRAEKLAQKKAQKKAQKSAEQREQAKKSSSSNSPGQAKNKAKISPPSPP